MNFYQSRVVLRTANLINRPLSSKSAKIGGNQEDGQFQDSYQPPNQLLFNNGFRNIYKLASSKNAQQMNVIGMGIAGLCSSYSINKLCQYDKQSIVGLVMYSFFTLATLRYVRNTYQTNSKLISQIDLSRCGGKLRVTSFSGLFGTKAKLYNIERISDVKYQDIAVLFSYEGDKYYLVQASHLVSMDVDLMQAILKGQLIDTSNAVDL